MKYFRLSAWWNVLSLCLLLSGFLQAQSIFTNPITGTNPNTANPYSTGQVLDANITASGIGRGAGVDGTNANNRYNANGWNTTSIDLTAYFEWVITPDPNYGIDFISLDYTGQRSGTGPTSFAFRSSVDGFASDIGTPTATGTIINLSAAAFQGVTSAITFRLYGWGATGAGGTFSVNDFTFNGAVMPIPMVSIEALTAAVVEAGPAMSAFRISRTGATTAALAVDYAIGGSASSADYAPMLSGTVIIPAGESFTDITITPIDDDLVEGTETLTLTLTANAAYDLTADVSATVHIEDNDFAYLTVTPSSASVNEGVGVYMSNVRLLIDSSPAGGRLQDAVTVQLIGVELSATFDDFTLTTPSVTFPAGSGNGATQPFEVAIVDDNLVEGNEFFDVAMVQTGYTGVPSIVQDNQVIPGFCNGNNNDCRNRQTIRITDNDLPDYTITTTGNAIVITDVAGNGETLEVTENGANIRFNAVGRIYTINGGAGITFPANVPLAGAVSITINAAGGDDIINIGAFTAALPSLTIDGGDDNDIVLFSGAVTYVADNNLEVLNTAVVTVNGSQTLSGNGSIDITANENITVNLPLRTAAGDINLSTIGGQDILVQAGINGIQSAGGITTLQAGQDLLLGSAAGFGDARGRSLELTAGRDIIVRATTFVQAGGLGGVTAASGRDITITNNSLINTNGGGEQNRLTTGANGLLTIDAGGSIGANNGAITLTADDVAWTGTVGTGGIVTVRPVSAGRSIDLGTNAAGSLSLTAAELDQITAGTLLIGDANSGDITISAAINRSAATDVELRSGGDIRFEAGFDTGGGTLLLAPGTSPAAVYPTFNGTDATASTVSFASDLAIVINGTTPGDGTASTYKQLSVAGMVNLTGVNLVLSGSLAIAGGESFTIVDNDGVDAITGTFVGLPEGATIADFLGSGLDATITYMAGDGNDVVLTVVVPCPTITFTATPTDACGTSNDGQISISNEAGGDSPYLYSVDGGTNYQPGSTFAGLAADTYQVKIKDANGCESDAVAVVVGSAPLSTFYLDIDNDGLGDPNEFVMACVAPSGYVADNTDACPLTVSSVSNSGNCGCAPGFFPIITEMSGEEVITGCQPCPAGSFCPDGLTAPIPCSAGRFSDAEGAIACAPCAAGTFNGLTGQTACVGCPEGTFSDQVGATECTPCLAGTSNGMIGQTACVSCPAGTFSDQEGAAECTPCPAFTFTATPADISCSTSADGQITISSETGGTAPYMYSIDNGATYQSGATFTSLAADTYQVKIKDANDCESDAAAVVVAAPTCPATGTLTWTGAADTDWSNPCNWDAGCVPTANNEVVIPDVANAPIITAGTAALAKAVNVQPNASLSLEAMSSLTLEGASGTSSGGMYNQGTVVNNGNIDIGPNISPGEYGLVNEGIFSNEAGSELSIDRTSNIGLWIKGGTFANAGKITTGAVVGTFRPGIYNEGDIQNNGGEIEIDRYGGAGIDNRPNGTISNSGMLAIGQLSGPLGTCIYNFGHIQNLAAGEIKLDNGNSGIFTTTTGGVSSSFTNAGKIDIGQTGLINGPGIFNQSASGASASFNNLAGAEILLDRTSAAIHNDANCAFDNSGLIKIATIVTGTGFNPAIYNRSTFNNYAGAEIQIDRIPRTGLHHQSGTFTNEGKIIVGINITITNFSPGVYNEATFVNREDAEMHIDQFTHVGFQNAFNSSMTNAGLIKIGENVLGGNNGLFNDGTFENQATGEIHVDNIPDGNNRNGIFNSFGDTFTNAGKLFIGSAIGGGSTGLFNSGTFDNSGEITVDNIRGTIGRHGLLHNGDTFTNTGKINLGNTGSLGDFGIYTSSTFNNAAAGEITIDRCAITGLRNGGFSPGGPFTNAGKITIGANASVGDWGLWNNSNFNNSGELNIDNAAVTGLRHQAATFTNTGKVVLGGIASIGEWGLWNQAAFNNEASGEIHIDRSSNTGLLNFLSTFTNRGVVAIGANTAVGNQALYNEATFNNEACAALRIFAPLNNVSTFTNSGLMLVNTTATHTNTALTNSGIIAYPQGNPIPSVTNDEIIIAPFTSSNCSMVSPAFTLGSPVDFNILGVFTDEAGTQSAGTYVAATNTFTPTGSLAEGTYDYFVQINDPLGGCIRTVPWNLTTENCALISGNIVWEHDRVANPIGVANVVVELSGDDSGSDNTDALGDYAISASGSSLTLTPRKMDLPYEGVDVADVTRIQQHVTFVNRLDDGYKVIAADVNQSNSVTGLDAAVIFHALNGNPNAQAIFQTSSWRFVEASHIFNDQNAPWAPPFPEEINLMDVVADVLNQDFVGVKMGDVNGTWNSSMLISRPALELRADDQVLVAGQRIRVPFRSNGLADVAAWQFALRFDTDYLSFERALPTRHFPLDKENFGAWEANRGELRSVFAVPQGQGLPKGAVIFELEFQVKQSGLRLSEVLRLAADILPGRVYDTQLQGAEVRIHVSGGEARPNIVEQD